MHILTGNGNVPHRECTSSSGMHIIAGNAHSLHRVNHLSLSLRFQTSIKNCNTAVIRKSLYFTENSGGMVGFRSSGMPKDLHPCCVTSVFGCHMSWCQEELEIHIFVSGVVVALQNYRYRLEMTNCLHLTYLLADNKLDLLFITFVRKFCIGQGT